MIKRFMSVMTILLLTHSVLAADELTLVKDGEANCTIVLGKQPILAVRWAAGELQSHIQKITGAMVPVVRDGEAASGVKIYIGESESVGALGIKTDGFKPQEFAIQFAPNAIVLIGSDDGHERQGADEPLLLAKYPDWPGGEKGSLYATYEFLEKFCGVRWFAPGDLGLSLTERKTLTVTVADIRRTLSFEDRKPVWIQYNQWGDYKDTDPDVAIFKMRLKLGGRGNFMGHTFEGFFDRFKKQNPNNAGVWEGARPDFFSQKSGMAHQLCFTSTGLLAQVAKDAREFFDGKGLKHRSEGGSDWYGVGPCDTFDWCTCSNCAALLQTPDPNLGFANRTASRLVWSFASDLAREIAKTHPDKSIACYAYADYTELPVDVNFATNMYVVPAMFTRSWIPDGGQNLRQYRDWAKKFPCRVMSMWIYPCFPQEIGTTQGYYVFPCFEAHEMSKNFKEFAKDGMKGFNVCGGYEPVEYWLYGKLTDDATQDVDALLADYFSGYYGAAAAPMKQLYLEIEQTYWTASNYPGGWQDSSERAAWDSLGTKERMAGWQKLMDEAVALAQTDMEKKRLGIFKAGIWDYMVKGRQSWLQKKLYQVEVDAAKLQPPPSFDVARIPEVEGGDPGKVDWSNVQTITINRNTAGYPLESRKADLKMAHDGKTFYMRLDDYCDTASMEDYGCAWWGDHWELFFSAQRDLKAGQTLADRDRGEWGPYRQLGIRASGQMNRWSSNEPDFKVWDAAHLQLTLAREPTNWILQLSVPMDQISEVGPIKPGQSIFMHMFRGVRLEAGDTLALSPTFNPGVYHNIPRMAELKLAE